MQSRHRSRCAPQQEPQASVSKPQQAPHRGGEGGEAPCRPRAGSGTSPSVKVVLPRGAPAALQEEWTLSFRNTRWGTAHAGDALSHTTTSTGGGRKRFPPGGAASGAAVKSPASGTSALRIGNGEPDLQCFQTLPTFGGASGGFATRRLCAALRCPANRCVAAASAAGAGGTDTPAWPWLAGDWFVLLQMFQWTQLKVGSVAKPSLGHPPTARKFRRRPPAATAACSTRPCWIVPAILAAISQQGSRMQEA